jgi:hypothetical protein
MPYCTRCGVEVNEEAKKCPLCSSPIQQFNEDPAPGREYPEDALNSAAPRLTRKERIKISVFMTSFGIMIPLFITMAVDIAVNRSITWSIYPIIGLTSSWLLTILPLIKQKNSSIIIWGEFFILSVTFIALRGFTPSSSGIVYLGIPIVFFGALVSQGIVYVSSRTVRKGSNTAGFILIGIGIFCGLTDILLSCSLWNSFRMSWSLIVLAALAPVSGMLLYLHYSKKKRNGFSRYFHI